MVITLSIDKMIIQILIITQKMFKKTIIVYQRKMKKKFKEQMRKG